jgi:hypothetical protein
MFGKGMHHFMTKDRCQASGVFGDGKDARVDRNLSAR